MSEQIQPRAVVKCRSYIQYPNPAHPMAAGQHPWRVADICRAYGLPQATLPGGGVIGILELGGGWHQSDLDQFSQINSLPRIAVTDVSVGAGNSPGNDADGEVALDIQVAAAAAYCLTGRMPQVRVYWAQNTTEAFAQVVSRAAADGCDVLSVSWGTGETNVSKADVVACEAAVAAAAKLGMVVTCASGDNSASDGTGGTTVDFPSCCPSVVACGGTMKSDADEVVWGTGNSRGSGTGGGFSKDFDKPAYQSVGPKNPGRMVPDVAANADPNTGWMIVLNGREMPIGGTSAVAPFYAGLYAAFGKRLGSVNPVQWANVAAFGDIVTGSNGWKAIAGPDACTGLGVPTARLPAVFVGTVPVPPVPPVPPTPPAAVNIRGVLTVVSGSVTGFTVTTAATDPFDPAGAYSASPPLAVPHGVGPVPATPAGIGSTLTWLGGEVLAGLGTAERWIDEYGSDAYGIGTGAQTVLSSGTAASVADLIVRVKKLIADIGGNMTPAVSAGVNRARFAIPDFDWVAFLTQLIQALLAQLLAPPQPAV